MNNVNSETGIRYGTIYAREVPILEEKIIRNGDDLSFAAHKADCIKRVAQLLEDLGQRNAESAAKSIVDDFEWDDYQCDEPSYEYRDRDGNEFFMSYLGGANLIWAIKTSKIVHARSLCSPCVPNAADLDSGIVGEGEGYECYGIPDDYIGEAY